MKPVYFLIVSSKLFPFMPPGRVTQSVERLTKEPEVPGSILGPAHTLVKIDHDFFYGHFPVKYLKWVNLFQHLTG